MVQGQITSTDINQNKYIIGLHVPNQKQSVKIPQYVDDSNFFLKNQESVKNVTNFFRS